jgi:pimeloyl-ACP methyl ester carboxylesterase
MSHIFNGLRDTMTTTTTLHVNLVDVGPVVLSVAEYGDGQPFLLLHGGGGPDTVSNFAEQFAKAHPARVITPIHPGFGGTPRPEGLHTIRGLAALYVALLEQLQVTDVTVVGNSIGGWIAAEMGLLASPRVSRVILVDAVGVQVPGHPIADFFSLSMDQVFQLGFHNPGPFRVDPSSLAPAAQAVMAGNRAALATYAGAAMYDPSLMQRLSEMETPTLVLWGESDRIVDSEYGRAFAAAIPMAQFELLPATGHMPQIETPDSVLGAISDRANTDSSSPPLHAIAPRPTDGL